MIRSNVGKPATVHGFTLIEVMVSAVLLALVVAGISQVMVSQSRFHRSMTAQSHGAITGADAKAQIMSDLRDLSPTDGDLISGDSASASFLATQSLGVVCAIAGSIVTLAPIHGTLYPGDSAQVYVDGDTTTSRDDGYQRAVVTPSNTYTPCPLGSAFRGTGEQQVTILPSLKLVIGDVVRTYVPTSYSLSTIGGHPFLIRSWVHNSGLKSSDILAGPLQQPTSLFLYLDASGAPALNMHNARTVVVTLPIGDGSTNSLRTVLGYRGFTPFMVGMRGDRSSAAADTGTASPASSWWTQANTR